MIKQSAMHRFKQLASPELIMMMTLEQNTSVVRVIRRQGVDKLQGVSKDFCYNTVMLQFTHIVIGIEPDGYAHS